MAARGRAGSVVDRHPTLTALPLLGALVFVVDTDVRRLVTAVSTFGPPIGVAIAVGAALAASSIGVLAWWISSIRRAVRAGRYDRSSPANRWRRRVAAGWTTACVAVAVAAHFPPRFHTAEQWRLTDRLGAATVAYLLVLVLALMAALIVVFIVMPMAIRWENARRRASARKHRSAD